MAASPEVLGSQPRSAGRQCLTRAMPERGFAGRCAAGSRDPSAGGSARRIGYLENRGPPFDLCSLPRLCRSATRIDTARSPKKCRTTAFAISIEQPGVPGRHPDQMRVRVRFFSENVRRVVRQMADITSANVDGRLAAHSRKGCRRCSHEDPAGGGGLLVTLHEEPQLQGSEVEGHIPRTRRSTDVAELAGLATRGGSYSCNNAAM